MKIIRYIFIVVLTITAIEILAQQERKYIREGNDLFEKDNFEQSEVEYRKAIDKAPNSYSAGFNLGDALFKQEKYEEAIKQFNSIAELAENKEDRAKAYHNLGNSFLSSQKLEEGIEAYKNALRNNPSDMETKYNLAWAQDKLDNQQKQQQQNQDQNQDQDQQQDKQQQQNQDQQEQEKQKQQQEQKEQEKQEKEQQQAKQKKEQISKEDAQRILEALQQDEQKVQEKIKKEQAKAKKVKIDKDW